MMPDDRLCIACGLRAVALISLPYLCEGHRCGDQIYVCVKVIAVVIQQQLDSPRYKLGPDPNPNPNRYKLGQILTLIGIS